ncbi:MAG: hypothetical protein HKN65_08805, partial [Woeseiaceae bacterium]|nr:hypothetical protein [Woeseiaceae bacterium]
MTSKTLAVCSLACALIVTTPMSHAQAQKNPTYDDLLELFVDWREFESPPLLDGAPDYTTEQFAARQPGFLALRERLDVFQIDEW